MLRDLALKEQEELGEVLDLAALGEVANHVASQSAFEDYRSRRAKNTLRRQDAELALFAKFLQSRGVEVGQLNTDPQAWTGIS